MKGGQTLWLLNGEPIYAKGVRLMLCKYSWRALLFSFLFIVLTACGQGSSTPSQSPIETKATQSLDNFSLPSYETSVYPELYEKTKTCVKNNFSGLLDESNPTVVFNNGCPM